MGKNTSIVLGAHFEKFINEQIASGKYSSVSEVVRTALRVFEQEEEKARFVIDELQIGEKSEKLREFNRHNHLKDLHERFEP